MQGHLKKINKTSDYHKINYWMKYAIQHNPDLIENPLIAMEFNSNGDVNRPSKAVIDIFNKETGLVDENGCISKYIELGKNSPQKLKMVREMLYRNDSFKPENFVMDLLEFNNIANNIIEQTTDDEYKKQFILLVAENFKKNSDKVKNLQGIQQISGEISPLMVQALTLPIEIKGEKKSQSVYADMVRELPEEIQNEILSKKQDIIIQNKEVFKYGIVPQNELLEYRNIRDYSTNKINILNKVALFKIIKNPEVIGKRKTIEAVMEYVKNKNQIIETVNDKKHEEIFDLS